MPLPARAAKDTQPAMPLPARAAKDTQPPMPLPARRAAKDVKAPEAAAQNIVYLGFVGSIMNQINLEDGKIVHNPHWKKALTKMRTVQALNGPAARRRHSSVELATDVLELEIPQRARTAEPSASTADKEDNARRGAETTSQTGATKARVPTNRSSELGAASTAPAEAPLRGMDRCRQSSVHSSAKSPDANQTSAKLEETLRQAEARADLAEGVVRALETQAKGAEDAAKREIAQSRAAAEQIAATEAALVEQEEELERSEAECARLRREMELLRSEHEAALTAVARDASVRVSGCEL